MKDELKRHLDTYMTELRGLLRRKSRKSGRNSQNGTFLNRLRIKIP